MKLQSFKRIVTEDYDEKDRPLVSKIGNSFNVFAEEVQNAFNKNINIDDNLSMVKKVITVTVDGSGVPTSTLLVKSGLNGNCVGMQVIKATNLTTPSTSPTGTPFITFSDNSGEITISKITNLQTSNKYQLRVILYT